jgi:hypothetical protein
MYKNDYREDVTAADVRTLVSKWHHQGDDGGSKHV